MQVEEVDAVQTYQSSDGLYSLAFGKGTRSDRTPMLWLEYRGSKGRGYSGEEADGKTAWGVEETARREQELTKKAETLLGKLSTLSFAPKEIQWKALGETGPDQGWGPEEQYYCQIRFERVYDGIPCLSIESCWAAEGLQSPQYVQICFSEGGTLLELKMINRERVLADLGTVEFLFPFEAAAQIFEQYMRYYQTVYQVPEWYLEQGEGVGMAEAGGSPRLYLEVTKVRFLYELRYDDWNEETLDRGNGRGRLVPVWAFYGTPRIRQGEGGELTAAALEDSLLLTVNAENGMVYGKE